MNQLELFRNSKELHFRTCNIWPTPGKTEEKGELGGDTVKEEYIAENWGFKCLEFKCLAWLCCERLSLAGLFLDKNNYFLPLGSKVVTFFLEVHRHYVHRSVSNTNMACRVLEFSLCPLDFILNEVSIIFYTLLTYFFASFKNSIQLIRKNGL